MRKKITALILGVTCLIVAVGIGVAVAKEEKTPSLYDRGLEVVQVLSEMAGSEEYVDAVASTDAVSSIIRDIDGDYSAPKAVYSLSVTDEELEELAALNDLGDLGDLSDDMKTFLRYRVLGSLMNIVNSMGSSETLVAATICTYAKTFVNESAERDVIYLYTYEDAPPVAVTFIPGEDHAVTASGMFVLNDSFTCGSAREIKDFFDFITVDVAEVSPEK